MSGRSFAPIFKPTFRACDLAVFTNSPDEKVELKLLFKYKPFSKYKPKQVVENPKHTPITPLPVVKELRPKDKEMINKEWQKQLSKGSINFNDQSIIAKVNENITQSFLNELDDDSNETKMIRNMDFSKIEVVKPAEPPAFKIDYDVDAQSKKEKIGADLEAYKSIAKATVYMERGNQLEKSIIKRLNESENYNFIKQQEVLRTADLGLFKICGIPDGVDEARSTVVEVKTRHFINSSKKTICLRERVQCLCYLRLTNCKVCLLVESGPSGERNVHRIEWDQDEFESVIVDKLSDFVNKYRKISEAEFSQIAKKYKYNQIFC